MTLVCIVKGRGEKHLLCASPSQHPELIQRYQRFPSFISDRSIVCIHAHTFDTHVLPCLLYLLEICCIIIFCSLGPSKETKNDKKGSIKFNQKHIHLRNSRSISSPQNEIKQLFSIPYPSLVRTYTPVFLPTMIIQSV